MADRYWVGGTGNWSDNTNHWSTSSGGAGGASKPTASDNVIFDQSSSTSNAAYTVTIDEAAVCLNFTMDGPHPSDTNKVTWAGTFGLTISGSMNLSGTSAGITRTYTGAITFDATSTGKTITTGGVTFATGAWTFNGSGGGWTLQDNLDIGSATTLQITNGTFDTGTNRSVTCGQFNASAAGTRTINLNASLITASSLLFVSSGSFTFNEGTSSITITSSTFSGGGETFYDVSFTANSTVSISGANTFHNITMTSTGTMPSLGANQTVSNLLTITGPAANSRIFVSSDTPGQSRTITAASVSLTDVDFQDITGAGAASWTGTRIGDCLGNSGITFTAATNKYYVGNTNTWYAANVWATTSGGGGATNNQALPQDTAIFDGNSFSANGQTITATGGRIGPIDFSGLVETGIVIQGSTASFFGDITVKSTMTWSIGIVASKRSTQTLTTNGVTLSVFIGSNAINVNAPGCTLLLADNCTINSAKFCIVTRGTLDINGKTLSTGRFQSNGSGTRTITFGAGKIVTTDTAAATVFDCASTTNLTVNRNTGSIEVGGNTTNTRTFAGGTATWPTVTFTNTTANGRLDFTGSATYKSLAYSGGTAQSLRFTSGTTTTIEDQNGFPSGTSGNVITIDTVSGTGTFTLNKAYSGAGPQNTVNCDYLSITRSNATPGNSWYAGANSTNGGTNTGWVFGVRRTTNFGFF